MLLRGLVCSSECGNRRSSSTWRKTTTRRVILPSINSTLRRTCKLPYVVNCIIRSGVRMLLIGLAYKFAFREEAPLRTVSWVILIMLLDVVVLSRLLLLLLLGNANKVWPTNLRRSAWIRSTNYFIVNFFVTLPILKL